MRKMLPICVLESGISWNVSCLLDLNEFSGVDVVTCLAADIQVNQTAGSALKSGMSQLIMFGPRSPESNEFKHLCPYLEYKCVLAWPTYRCVRAAS